MTLNDLDEYCLGQRNIVSRFKKEEIINIKRKNASKSDH